MSTETKFAEWLRQARIEHGWSQQKVADLLAAEGISWHQTQVTKTETGARPIRLNEAAALAEIFGSSLDEMIDGPARRLTLERRVALLEERVAELRGLR